MAGTTSVSGLVSGLDTATIIDQLMQVEGTAQTRLKSRLANEQAGVSSLQDLNSRLAALATTAEGLADATAWNPVSITSSSDRVAVTGSVTTVPGTLSLTVGHTARAHQLTSSGTAALSDVVTSGTTVRLDRLDGTTLDIDTGDGTLAGLVRGLNAAGTGVRASTVRLDDGSYRLQVTATDTGAASDFTLTNLDGSDLLGGAAVTAGRDAELTIGSDVVHSSGNTFTDIANGLSITLQSGIADGTVVELDISSDTSGMTAKVKAYVDAVNDVLSRIDSLTGYNVATKTAGPLAGDASVRELRSQLLNSVYPPGGGTLADVGVQLDRYGKLTFDADRFTAAYAQDPAAVAAKFTSGVVDGFAARVQSLAAAASDPVGGLVTTAINGRNSGIARIQTSIDDWDDRLALRRETLTRTFTALETTLSQLNAQSNWLSGQIASLSGSNGSQ